ncbi:MAG: AAA family ATPase [Lewinellaceae bacterium]|nr:AAA family ATPase [Lewinellaceae bacterium]
MKLKEVTIHKYKSIESDQNFQIEDDVTVLVGMNESGKTSILEALAKSNYFQKDSKFQYNTTHDYPRKEKKKLDKSGEDPYAISCIYTIPEILLEKISKDVGKGVFTLTEVKVSHKFSNQITWENIKTDFQKFIEGKTTLLEISSKTLNDKLLTCKNETELQAVISEYKDENIIKGLSSLNKYFENTWKRPSDPIAEYISKTYLLPNLPKFLYYDEYYALPSRISIENLQEDNLEDEELKTAKALFELADIDVEELIGAENYEDFKAELEATQATITEELFKYWETNKNLEIVFDIDKRQETEERTVTNPQTRRQEKVTDVKIVEHILDIRVKNRTLGVSLPLKNRSKGFNWFFSFLVWFKKIQEDQNNNYILLLDEPGLNLHATAQSNLLKFLNDLSKDYQIIYSTHSPFMIKSESLNKVRTVLETDKGSVVSDSVQEKDPNTLFPLQAALGYNIAQNLFISHKNLLVEGVSDLIYLQSMSSIVENAGKEGLKSDITIVPTGGLEKVATFISLLRSNELQIICLLDSFTDAKGKAKLENLIVQKIINQKNIRFFHEFLDNRKRADIEDLFAKKDYLTLFNEAFNEYADIKDADLNTDIEAIVIQINQHLSIPHFNHYRPANQLVKKGLSAKDFDQQTIDNFAKVFAEINKLFI